MRNPQGYGVWTSPEGVKETDTLTCNHCNRIYDIPPFASPDQVGGFCGACFRPICPQCDQALQQTRICSPFEKHMDKLEQRDRLLRQLGVNVEVIGGLVHDDTQIRQILGPNV